MLYLIIRGDILSNILYIELIINNKHYHITDNNKIDYIARIIRNWPLKSFSNRILDGEEYLIKVVANNKETNYIGKGKYPKGYITLKKIIGDNND